MVERALRNHHIGIAQCFEDGQSFFEGNDRRTLVTAHQFVGTYAHNERIAQSTGVFDHLQVVGVEHIEGSGGINHYFVFSVHDFSLCVALGAGSIA